MRKRLVTHANVVHLANQRVVITTPQNILGTVFGFLLFNIIIYHLVAQRGLHIVLNVHVHIEATTQGKRFDHTAQFLHVHLRQSLVGSLYRIGLLTGNAHCGHRVGRIIGKRLIGTLARIIKFLVIYLRHILFEIVRCHIIDRLRGDGIDCRSPFGSLLGESTAIGIFPYATFVASGIPKVFW